MLFSFAGGSGHFNPLLPIANAARVAGHEVAFLGHRSYEAQIAGHGFRFFRTGKLSADSPKRLPLQVPDLAHELTVVRDAFAGRFARRKVEDILASTSDWSPDVIVCDEMDFGAMLAAEQLGIPHVSVIVIAAGGFATRDVIAESLNNIRAEIGLPPDPDCRMPGRSLILEPIPAGFRTPDDPLPASSYRIRPTNPDQGSGSWNPPTDGRPLLYFTLGTIFNLESGDLFGRVLAGLRELPFNVVMTVGGEINPAELGPQPDHIRIERYIPQALVLPHCAVVISHGGSGTVIGTLAQGVPQVLIPMGADQLLNGPRCEALGVGVALDPMTLTAEDVISAVTTVTIDPHYREHAQRIRAETAGLPGPEEAVGLIEAVVRNS